ncbi:hypothetical protein DSLASN_43360 [Desulfoluna limicola]|uniref:Uncharacterized protein n=1 Tax=Desulfoluna limicola TaxID=2810562 RepID=A0ABN6F8F7_9BACT|nr:hypothetical protein DSLASN_43360 [Desulfoluna limicola]
MLKQQASGGQGINPLHPRFAKAKLPPVLLTFLSMAYFFFDLATTTCVDNEAHALATQTE